MNMPTHVALLRGINIGGNKKVEMKRLKVVFESLGFEHVSTYINSGNVLFHSAKKKVDEKVIEKAMEKEFGFDIHTVIRDKDNINKLIKAIPKNYENNDDQKTDVLFLWDHFDNESSLELVNAKEGIDNLKYVAGAIIWNIDRKNYNKSAMNKFVGSKLYKHMTARNVNTVRKLGELMNK